MDLGIQDRVALVAASTAGLGKATAARLLQEGARVMICGRDRARLNSALQELEKLGTVRGMVADVTDAGQLERLVAETEKHLGPVDILVTNAGGPPSISLEDLNEDLWDRAIELNLKSTIRMCEHVLPGMRQRKWGRIVMIASVAAKQPIDSLILSNTARAGVLGYAKTLSNLVAPDNVLVNAVLPGYTRTDRVVHLARSLAEKGTVDEDGAYRQWEDNIPMGRLGEPDEFGSVVAFLCSERASYVTGVALQIDGGFTRTII